MESRFSDFQSMPAVRSRRLRGERSVFMHILCVVMGVMAK